MPIRSSVAPSPERPEIYNEEIVRNEMFLALGKYVTESSGHNSEYNWWFRKRPDLIEKYCLHGTGWNPGEYAYILKEYQHAEATWRTASRNAPGAAARPRGPGSGATSMQPTSSMPSRAGSRSSSTATCATPA